MLARFSDCSFILWYLLLKHAQIENFVLGTSFVTKIINHVEKKTILLFPILYLYSIRLKAKKFAVTKKLDSDFHIRNWILKNFKGTISKVNCHKYTLNIYNFKKTTSLKHRP